MDKFNVIGKNHVKKDVLDKVLGKALFSADIELDNMLYGAVKRSDVPSAYLKKVDICKAKSLPGVAAVLTAEDIPGENKIGIIIKDEPVLVSDKIRRIGDAIVIVAAETEEIAKEALELIEIEYEEIEPIFTIEDALKEDSHKIHGDSNLLQRSNLVHGDVDEAFKKCDVIVENTYKTNYLAHMFIEPEAGVASYENGIMRFWSSTQNPHYDRTEVARVLKLPQNRVRAVQATTGAGFGGKLDISVQCHTALLSYYTKRPVKMVRDREESMMVSSKRHPMTMKYKTGATRDGKILAMDIEMTGDTGAYASYGPAVITRATVHATGPYEIPNVRVVANFAYTNNPMAGAFRGFGVPQVAIAHEGQMNLLAKKIGMDPIELRLKNALRVGSKIATGQVLHDSVGIGQTIKEASEKAKEVIDKKGGEIKKRGVGVGCMWYGIGNTGLPNPAAAFVEVHNDATVTVLAGCADIGQGSTTAMAQIVAEALGLDYEDVYVTSADTGVTPEAGATSASRQTYISGNACLAAANMAKETLVKVAAEVMGVKPEEVDLKNKRAIVIGNDELWIPYSQLMAEMQKRGLIAVGSGSFNPDTTSLEPVNMQGIPYATYAFATHIVEVEVDTLTGEVRLLKIVAAHDVGRAINKSMVEGQIEGGSMMGAGFALLEKVQLSEGRITNPSFSKYLIYTVADMPEIYPIIVEDPTSTGPFGAKGVGEPALIPTAPAILNAIYDAIGIRFTEVPVTARNMIRALDENKKRNRGQLNG